MYKFLVSASAFGFAALLFALVLAMPMAGGGTGLEAANAPEGCEKIQGTIYCGPETENVGNAPDHSNSQETTTTTNKKGSLNSSHETQEECEGPPGQCK